MQYESAEFIGSTVLALSTLLGVYSLINRMRKPAFKSLAGPTLPYLPSAEFDSFRTHVHTLFKETTSDLRRVRQEIRTDYNYLFERLLNSFSEAHALIQNNAQHIATLIAQQQMTHQRLSELTIKTDKLYEKLLSPKS